MAGASPLRLGSSATEEKTMNHRQIAAANQLPSEAEAFEGLDSEELERLRSLGYVQ